MHVNLKVCKSDGNLANPGDIASGNYNSKEFFIFKEQDPTAAPGGPNQWQAGIDAWVATQSDTRYHPPTSYCGTGSPLDVEFTGPTDQTSNVSQNFTANFTVNSNSAITSANLQIDGTTKCTYASGQNSYSCNLSGISNGVHVLTANASDASGHSSNRIITIGVGVAWNSATPSPSPTATP